MAMIEGVATKPLKVIADERGSLMEILRQDDDLFERFGQVYTSTTYPGVVRAWHYHKVQTDFFVAISGMMKLVLYDPRAGSPTKGQVNEFFLGERNQVLVKIPALVVHGFKGIGVIPVVLVNLPTEVYHADRPDEFRLPWDSPEVPYNWAVKFS